MSRPTRGSKNVNKIYIFMQRRNTLCWDSFKRHRIWQMCITIPIWMMSNRDFTSDTIQKCLYRLFTFVNRPHVTSTIKLDLISSTMFPFKTFFVLHFFSLSYRIYATCITVKEVCTLKQYYKGINYFKQIAQLCFLFSAGLFCE